MFETLKRRICKHNDQNLQFIGVLFADLDGNGSRPLYQYRCNKCGKFIHKWQPIDCVGCEHLFTDESGAHCERNIRNITDRKCFDTHMMGITGKFLEND